MHTQQQSAIKAPVLDLFVIFVLYADRVCILIYLYHTTNVLIYLIIVQDDAEPTMEKKSPWKWVWYLSDQKKISCGVILFKHKTLVSNIRDIVRSTTYYYTAVAVTSRLHQYHTDEQVEQSSTTIILIKPARDPSTSISHSTSCQRVSIYNTQKRSSSRPWTALDRALWWGLLGWTQSQQGHRSR